MPNLLLEVRAWEVIAILPRLRVGLVSVWSWTVGTVVLLWRLDAEVADRQQAGKWIALGGKGLGAPFHAVDDRDHAVDLQAEGFDALDRLER